MASLDIAKHRESLEQIFSRYDVILAYLFGSQAAGKSGPLSDVDIAVLLDPEADPNTWSQTQLDLTNALMSLFHRNAVDVAILNRATPVLAYQVIRHGHVLYEANPGTQVDFEVKTLHRYINTKALREMQDQHLLGRVEDYRKDLSLSAR